nr:MAG TPA: hypothetical protein [Caudoviricetes sp.]
MRCVRHSYSSRNGTGKVSILQERDGVLHPYSINRIKVNHLISQANLQHQISCFD